MFCLRFNNNFLLILAWDFIILKHESVFLPAVQYALNNFRRFFSFVYVYLCDFPSFFYLKWSESSSLIFTIYELCFECHLTSNKRKSFSLFLFICPRVWKKKKKNQIQEKKRENQFNFIQQSYYKWNWTRKKKNEKRKLSVLLQKNKKKKEEKEGRRKITRRGSERINYLKIQFDFLPFEMTFNKRKTNLYQIYMNVVNNFYSSTF